MRTLILSSYCLFFLSCHFLSFPSLNGTVSSVLRDRRNPLEDAPAQDNYLFYGLIVAEVVGKPVELGAQC